MDSIPVYLEKEPVHHINHKTMAKNSIYLPNEKKKRHTNFSQTLVDNFGRKTVMDSRNVSNMTFKSI
jgi:hypothetical protein